MAAKGGRLAGRVAVVTGASKNIGRAIATAFAQEGADLVICARGKEALDEVASAIHKQTGRKVEAVVADVGERASIDELIKRANAAYPRIDILVNNAAADGGTHGTKFIDADWSSWDECVRANVMAPFLLSQEFGRKMMERGSGNIINIVGTGVVMLLEGVGPGACTKSALWTMTRYLAEALAPAVRVNAISPGGVHAPDHVSSIPGWQEKQLRYVPMKRTGKDTELAAAAVFLASDEASYMTCNLLFVDGGRGAIRKP